ncbi:hypothetical protein HMI56_000654 [Coelomomyces lativittatus]|nr:hypothetical protein HMI56_000654 [Coelomomyces lativittatus]
MLSRSLRTAAFRARQSTLVRGHGHQDHEFNPLPFSTKNKPAVAIGLTLAYATALSAPVLVCWFQYWKNGGF